MLNKVSILNEINTILFACGLSMHQFFLLGSYSW